MKRYEYLTNPCGALIDEINDYANIFKDSEVFKAAVGQITKQCNVVNYFFKKINERTGKNLSPKQLNIVTAIIDWTAKMMITASPHVDCYVYAKKCSDSMDYWTSNLMALSPSNHKYYEEQYGHLCN